jgi:hypothetical protein
MCVNLGVSLLFPFQEDPNLKLRIATLALTLLCLALSAPAFAGTIFDDGAINGNYNAFFVDGPNPGPFSQWIADQFVATGSGTPGEIDFGLWVPTGSTPTTITYWLGTNFLTSDISGGSAIALNAGNSTLVVTNNQYGYDVYEITLKNLTGSNMSANSTYWLTLGNANDSFNSQFDAWDVNEGPALCFFGVGQNFAGGCGDGGEAFTITMGGGATTPEPGTMVMLGTGIIGLAGALRRKINF